MKQGLEFRNTTAMVNENRLGEGNGHTGVSAARYNLSKYAYQNVA